MIRSDGAGSKDELRTPFVERRTYRRRRLMDIARLAPLIGALLFLVPLLWPQQDPGAGPEAPAASSLSSAMIYIFAVWGGLILFSVGFSVVVRLWAVHWTGSGGPVDPLIPGPAGADARPDAATSAPDTDPETEA